jgi:hypothetical protein
MSNDRKLVTKKHQVATICSHLEKRECILEYCICFKCSKFLLSLGYPFVDNMFGVVTMS